LLLIGHIFLSRQIGTDQNILAQAQREVSQGQAFQGNLKQLAVRIFQDSQKTQDAGLRDLLTRQQITFTAGPANTNATDTAVPPPSPSTH